MKACIFQLQYSRETENSDELFEKRLAFLDKCDDSLDIIVLPEYSDVPCAVTTGEELLYYHNKYIDILLSKCSETAKRCNALLFVNALSKVEENHRNTTYAFGKNGEIIGKYYKTHIPQSEKMENVAYEYTKAIDSTYILEVDGIRFAFLTCYDFYFYEAYAKIARNNVDIIIGCSLQRTDSHDYLETTCKFLAYNTNAYVLRSSVSFDENSTVCGASMIVSPEGKVLANMKGKFGMCTAEFNPNQKHLKAAGFGRGPAPHYEYIEEGRNPWQYRPAGSAICQDDNSMPYPRICAHRGGFNKVVPENSMLAFGMAVALGASEIEFDLWATKDKVLVSLHDSTLDRVSEGTGNVWDYTYEELLQFDFGIKSNEKFKGLKIVTFEEILKKFSCHVVMNVHVKIWDMDCENTMINEIVNLIKKYDCEKHVYFMTTNDKVLKTLKNTVPQINICVGHDSARPYEIVNRAIEIGAQKVQLYKPYFNQEMIDKAHEHGIRCNVFWSNKEAEAQEFLEMGIDTILTDNYQIVSSYTNIK